MKILNNNLTVSSITATNYYGLPTYASGIYMFTSSASDVSGMYESKILTSYTAATLITSATTVTTSETLMGEFITSSGQPNTTVLQSGKITVHFETQKASGSNNYYVLAKIYKRTSGGVETLLSTTDNSSSSALNTVVQQTLTATLSSNVSLNTTDRIVVKIYGVMLSSSASISLRWDDATESRMELPLAFGGGASGTSGTSGINGTSGDSGTSGTSGINGTSGTSSSGGGSDIFSGGTYCDYPFYNPNDAADIYWRTNISLANFTTTTESCFNNRMHFIPVQIANGKILTDFRFRVSIAGTTSNVGLYSCSVQNAGLNTAYIYPSTLRYVLSSGLTVSTTGTKTINGLNYTIDNSLTTSSMWFLCITSDNNSYSLTAWNGASSSVFPVSWGVYENAGTTYRHVGIRLIMSASTLPETLIPTQFNGGTVVNVTNPIYSFYKVK